MKILAKSLKVKSFAIMDLVLIFVTLISFEIPFLRLSFVNHLYDRYVCILLLMTIVHGGIFYNKNKGLEKYNKLLTMVIPIIPLYITGINFDLGIVISVIILNFSYDLGKNKIERLISYSVAGFAIIKFHLESYYSSPLSIVNYQVVDIFKNLNFGISMMCLVAFITSALRWSKNKTCEMVNIYWPILFIVISLKILNSPLIYDQYVQLLASCIAVATLLLWKRMYALAIFTSVLSLLFIFPLLYLIPLTLLAVIHFQGKFKVVKPVLKLEFLDIASLVIIVMTYDKGVSLVGVLSIVLFLFTIRKLKNEIIFG